MKTLDKTLVSLSKHIHRTKQGPGNEIVDVEEEDKVGDLTRQEYEKSLEAQDLNLPLYSHNYEIVYYLGKFIKRNKNLIHLDLSHTQLTEGMLWWIGSTLTRAPSLASLHLSGNPGITSELKRQLQLRIRCKKMSP